MDLNMISIFFIVKILHYTKHHFQNFQNLKKIICELQTLTIKEKDLYCFKSKEMCSSRQKRFDLFCGLAIVRLKRRKCVVDAIVPQEFFLFCAQQHRISFLYFFYHLTKCRKCTNGQMSTILDGKHKRHGTSKQFSRVTYVSYFFKYHLIFSLQFMRRYANS